MLHSARLLVIRIALTILACGAVLTGTTVIAQTEVDPYVTSPFEVDRFPYPSGSSTFLVPTALRPASDHYIICAAMIDLYGRVVASSALGCDGEKGPLCDHIDSLIPTLRFTAARTRGERVATVVVFPILIPATPDSVGSIGVPVTGEWTEGQCAYDGRIYGADELQPQDRPQVISKPEPKYPTTARLTGQEGEALINLVVGPDGLPCFVLCEAVRPVGMGFAEAAARAAWQYRFTPGAMDGKPQAVWVKIPFRWHR